MSDWLSDERTRRTLETRFEIELRREIDERRDIPQREAARLMMRYLGIEETARSVGTWESSVSTWLNTGRLPKEPQHLDALAWLLHADASLFAQMLGAQLMDQAIKTSETKADQRSSS